jgi:hypothetical protein
MTVLTVLPFPSDVSLAPMVSCDPLLAALDTSRHAMDPDVAADSAQRVTDALLPMITRVATIYAATWSGATVEVQDLVHEGVAAALAAMHHAPTNSREDTLAFFSAEVFRTLHARWMSAATARRSGATGTAEFLAPLRQVLATLSPRDVTLLELRSGGASWQQMGLVLDAAPAAAQRQYQAALRAARAAAAQLMARAS